MKAKLVSRRKAFTLIELVVAMGVFSILMLALMQFFSSAQKLWTSSSNKTEAFENARIALDMIANDVQCVYYEQDHSAKKLFFAFEGLGAVNGKTPTLALSSSRTNLPNANCKSSVCEVLYALGSDNVLYVNVTGDRTSSNATDINSNWNPSYEASGASASAGDNTFLSGSSDNNWVDIIPYVLDFQVVCYNKSLSSIPSTFTGSDKLPFMVVIQLTLLDKETFEKVKARNGGTFSASDDLAKNGKRLFTKSVIIERGQ